MSVSWSALDIATHAAALRGPLYRAIRFPSWNRWISGTVSTSASRQASLSTLQSKLTSFSVPSETAASHSGCRAVLLSLVLCQPICLRYMYVKATSPFSLTPRTMMRSEPVCKQKTLLSAMHIEHGRYIQKQLIEIMSVAQGIRPVDTLCLP
jgi:hypothetical protein